MGNSDCCGDKNLDVVEYDIDLKGKPPEKIIESNIKAIGKIYEKLILRKSYFIDKNYLINISNIPEIIEIINKNIELIDFNKLNIKKEEIKNILKNKIDLIILEIEQKIENISNEINNINYSESRNNEEINKYIEEFEPYKIKAINYINNINSDDLEALINKKTPSKNEYSILRLIFLIINPSDEVQIPGLIIQKDLEIMQKTCFNKGGDKIKQEIISRLNDLSKGISDILDENKIFIEFPFDKLNKLSKISELYQNLFGFFQTFINCEKTYQIYESNFKQIKDSKKIKDSLYKKKERLKKIKEEIMLVI